MFTHSIEMTISISVGWMESE